MIALENPDAARRAVGGIRLWSSSRALATHRRHEHEHREWLIDFGAGGNVAKYRLDVDAAVILAVRHQWNVGYEQ
ncbi:hypothetical protein [Variovorax sp. GT1P44]|uniref:hypothetical protein n=1 Tax=Variovorax sp. GT1P44 TaxID=3443742 RepID=UPI003F48F6EA